MKFSIHILILVLSINAFGQDLKKIELDLLKSLRKINAFELSSEQGNNLAPWDSLKKENEVLKSKLLMYSTKYPATLEYEFVELKKENFYITTSEDKKFRIYSWDTFEGGSSHYFENIYQYKSDKVYSVNFDQKRSPEDFGGYYSDIVTLDTNNRKVYLAYFNAIYSERDGFQAIQPFEITQNGLNDKLPLVKTKTGLIDKLGFDYDISLSQNTKKLIFLENKGKLIKLPQISKEGKVTNKYVSYQYTGEYFEKQKN